MTRVLLLEDNSADALLLQVWLDAAGARWDVEHVVLFAEAERRLACGAYDALLLDLDVPDGFGLTLLARALARCGTLPVVVLTGHADARVETDALRLGAAAYVVKGHAHLARLIEAVTRSTTPPHP